MKKKLPLPFSLPPYPPNNKLLLLPPPLQAHPNPLLPFPHPLQIKSFWFLLGSGYSSKMDAGKTLKKEKTNKLRLPSPRFRPPLPSTAPLGPLCSLLVVVVVVVVVLVVVMLRYHLSWNGNAM